MANGDWDVLNIYQSHYNNRSLVAKECINRVCDFANLRSPKKRKVERRIQEVSCCCGIRLIFVFLYACCFVNDE
jgi:hypothetical protein